MNHVLQKLSSVRDAEETIMRLLDLPYLTTEKKMDLLTLSWRINEDIYREVLNVTNSKVIETVLIETHDRHHSLSDYELLQLKCKIHGIRNPNVDHLIDLLKSKTLSVIEEGKILAVIMENTNMTQAELAKILGISRPSILYRIQLASKEGIVVKQRRRGRPKHQVINFERYNLPLKVTVKKDLPPERIAEMLKVAASLISDD